MSLFSPNPAGYQPQEGKKMIGEAEVFQSFLDLFKSITNKLNELEFRLEKLEKSGCLKEDKKCEHDYKGYWRFDVSNWFNKNNCPTCPFCRPEPKEEKCPFVDCPSHQRPPKEDKSVKERLEKEFRETDVNVTYKELAEIAIEFVKSEVSKTIIDDFARGELLRILSE